MDRPWASAMMRARLPPKTTPVANASSKATTAAISAYAGVSLRMRNEQSARIAPAAARTRTDPTNERTATITSRAPPDQKEPRSIMRFVEVLASAPFGTGVVQAPGALQAARSSRKAFSCAAAKTL